MSDTRVRRREEAGGGAGEAAGAEAAAPPPAPPFASLTQQDVLHVFSIAAHTLARRKRTAEAEARAASDLSAAWAARAPRPDDDDKCLGKIRAAAEYAAGEAWMLVYSLDLLTIARYATVLCRDTWRCVPPGLSAADADRVRAQRARCGAQSSTYRLPSMESHA